MTTANGTVDMSATLSGFEHETVAKEDRRDWFAPASPRLLTVEELVERAEKRAAEYEPVILENEPEDNIYEEEDRVMNKAVPIEETTKRLEARERARLAEEAEAERPDIPEVPANVDCHKLTRSQCQDLIHYYAPELAKMCIFAEDGCTHVEDDGEEKEYRQHPCTCTTCHSATFTKTLEFPGVYDNIEGAWLVPNCPICKEGHCDCSIPFDWEKLADNPYVPTNILRYVATSLCQHLNHNEGLRRDKEAQANH